MLRQDESDLIQFCAGQHRQIDSAAWLTSSRFEPDLLAFVALLLGSNQRYGWRSELLAIVEQINPRIAQEFLPVILKHDFDCARFTHMVEHELGID
jgi:hypothetical protein